MLARRIIALSPDKAFAKQLAVALKAAGGTVDTHLTLEELGAAEIQAALVVVHLDGAMVDAAAALIPRMLGETRVIAILPRTSLAAVVEIMQGSDRVAGMMVAEDFDITLLSAMATRVLAGDIFGLEKHIAWGAQIHSFLVGDYQEKSLCISQISEFCELMGVRRKYRESIEQCLDEMLMNALYDAPVDEQGRQIFSEIPTKTRISLRVEQKVVVQYVCDGKQFAIGVRDSFGTLERATVLRYLDKCLHTEQQIDRKVGGAGLGLYIITNSATGVFFNVLPGVATEAVCTFDLEAPKVQLESFGFFVEKIDAAGRLASGPSKRLPAGASHPVERRSHPPAPAGSRALIIVLAAAIVTTLGLGALVAWPRIFGGERTQIEIHTIPAGAVIEIEGRNAGTATGGTLVIQDLEVGRAYPVVARLDGYEPRQAVIQPHEGAGPVTLELVAHAATVEIDTVPTGASIEIDGKPVGVSPLTLRSLPPGTPAVVTFKKAGYHDATAKLGVPGPGKETRLIQPLAVSEELARVKLVSEPPGAQVVQNGQLVAGVVTPCELLVEAGKPTRFVLTMPHKIPVILAPFTPPRGADDIELSGKLVDGVTLHLRANLEARFRVAGAPYCQDVAAPFDCVVTPGSHLIELIAAQAPRITRTVVAKQKDLDVKFELGYVEASAGKLVQVAPGMATQRATFEVGAHRVTITGGDDGTHQASVVVRPGVTSVAN
ncbi:MAG TPA: PEGA domain-containing protein [Kofleriaceae bacterium]|nr:PEGA domain-containing protein [Kofleriaceae bacterium]